MSLDNLPSTKTSSLFTIKITIGQYWMVHYISYCVFLQVRYIHSYPDNSAPNNNPVMVQAYIGTPPHMSARSQLKWRFSSLHVADESISAAHNTVQAITSLGPAYVGNFQSISLPGWELNTTHWQNECTLLWIKIHFKTYYRKVLISS